MSSKSIVLKGTTYNGVESIELPQSGGGNALFTEVSDTTATASDVASGKYFYTSAGVKTEGTASGGGGGLEYEMGTWIPAEDASRGVVSFANTHTTAPAIVEISDVNNEMPPADSAVSMVYVGIEALHGGSFNYTAAAHAYGVSQFLYMSSSQTIGGNRAYISSATGSTATNMPGYWVDETAFHPYTNSSSRYWRAGRTYKWIAVWAPTT